MLLITIHYLRKHVEYALRTEVSNVGVSLLFTVTVDEKWIFDYNANKRKL